MSKFNDLTPTQQEQYKAVASELRCLVCQNQSLADSHASLAIDLKDKIAQQIQEGKSNEEIESFMQSRYGEFVLYKPTYSWENAVLWLGPFVVLVLAIVLARRVIRAQSPAKLTGPVEPDPSKVGDWAEQMYQRQQKQQDKV